jgi:membrane-associated protein
MFDVTSIVTSAGLIGLFLIVFAESGLFFGFFLPGDSLLFTAGFLASQGILNIWLLVPILFIAAVLGDSVGYAFGHHVGPRIFNKPKSRFFNPEHVRRAERFFEKYGSKALVMARFVPVVRTFVPIVAGVANMSYRLFLTYNVVGGLLWAAGMTLLGYFLGQTIPHAEEYLAYIIITIILISFIPVFWEYWRERKASAHTIQH